MRKSISILLHTSLRRNHKKKHRLYFVFFCIIKVIIIKVIIIKVIIKSSLEGGIREWPITAADVASFVVVVNARVTHQRESAGEARVRREVRAVVKSSITRNTQAELVFVEFRHSLFLRKLEPGFVGLRRRLRRRRRSFHSRRRRHASSGSSSSPVAGSNMLGHRSSFVRLSLSQVAIIHQEMGKVFQFYSDDAVSSTSIKNTRPCVLV